MVFKADKCPFCLIVDKLEFGTFVKHVLKAHQLLFCQGLY